ncbi:MAG: ATP-binding cassette domain-containing protein, partial [Hypericibacter sp.]
MTSVLATSPIDAGVPESIAVRDLRVVIASSAADVVDEVGFDLVPGEILGLVGESGSGKTTVGLALLKHCRRGLAIAGGSVLIAGQDLLRLPEAA